MDFFSAVFRPFSLFDSFWTLPKEDYGAIRRSRAYVCQCGRPVFFRNSECLACHTPLGFDTGSSRLEPLAAVEGHPNLWTLWKAPEGAQYRRCANLHAIGCNWLVPGDGAHDAVCLACSLNRTVSDPELPENLVAWRALEIAKRHLVAQLMVMGLPVEPRQPDHPKQLGLAFDFLRPTPEKPVLTGHHHGLITLNMDEADDARREQVRTQMGESYRTLLGLFRHEVGHYYCDRLVVDTPWLTDYRALFGDERADYAAALKHHYEEGPPADWAQRYVSTYASTHPWEDWAETWAHYLHMVDLLETASAYNTRVVVPGDPPDGAEEVCNPFAGEADFDQLVSQWVPVTLLLNSLNRSLGQNDAYPFALTPGALRKLRFVHDVIQQTTVPA